MSSSSGWLSDTTANKIKHSYINGFLDVSGSIKTYQSGDYDWNAYGQLISGPYESDNVYFGVSVGMDVSGLTIVVGANRQDGANTASTDDGAVTVYRYDTTAELWYQLGNKITGETNNVDFGYNTDMNDAGNRIMVTDPGDFVNVYDYDISTNTWDKQTSITAHTVANYAGRISGDGNTIIFADYTVNSYTGKIFVYRDISGSWTKIGEFDGASAGNHLGLGPAVSYDGNRVTLNERNYDFDENGDAATNTGRVRIFEYSGTPLTWNQVGNTIYGKSSESTLAESCDFSKDGSIVALGTKVAGYAEVYQYNSATSTWNQIGSRISDGAEHFAQGVRLSDDGTILLLSDYHANNQLGSVSVYKYINNDWVQQGSTKYGAYPGARLGFQFNGAVSMSGDGSKIVAGGVYANVNNPSVDTGYVQAWQWSKKAHTNPFLDANNQTMTIWGDAEHNVNNYSVIQLGSTLTGNSDNFGYAVNMNYTGDTMVITAPTANTINNYSGEVYVYKYRNGIWGQVGSTLIGEYDASYFGIPCQISNDGKTIAIGSHKASDGGTEGAVYVYEYVNGDWSQKGSTIDGSTSGNSELFGARDTCLSGDGTVVAGYSSEGGYAKVFKYVAGSTNDWVQMGSTFTTNSMNVGSTSITVQSRLTGLSDDGTIFAVSSISDDTTGTNNGKVEVYKFTGETGTGSWSQLGSTIYGINHSSGESKEGSTISLSADGTILATGSWYYNSSQGIIRVYKYIESIEEWAQMGTDILHNEAESWARGYEMSADGKTLAVGVANEDNSSGSNTGAVYIYKYMNGNWVFIKQVNSPYEVNDTYLGKYVTISGDGKRFAAGSNSNPGLVVAWEITNNPQLKIDSGNVGIGTTSPKTQLEVRVNDAYSGLAVSRSDVKMVLGMEATTTNAGTIQVFSEVDAATPTSSSSTYNLLLNPNGGNVGIGTSNPMSALEVANGAASFTGNATDLYTTQVPGLHMGLYISPGGNKYPMMEFVSNHTAGEGGGWIDFKDDVDTHTDFSGRIRYDITSNLGFRFYTNNAERMCIRYDTGYVGIAKTSPSALLDVNGGMRAGYNGNYTSYFGRAAIGYTGHSDWASFGHLDKNNTTGYALLQSSAGNTLLNSASGQSLNFRINNADIGKFHSNGTFEVYGSSNLLGRIFTRKYLHFYGENVSTREWFVGPWDTMDSFISGAGVADEDRKDFAFAYGHSTDRLVGYIDHSDQPGYLDFTGQHRGFIENIRSSSKNKYNGLIVSANKNEYFSISKGRKIQRGKKAIEIDESLPYVSLSCSDKDKSCYGVISGFENDSRTYSNGIIQSVYDKTKGDNRAFINSLGEGAIWVSNKNGSLESGDYITTSSIPGYGQKQDSEFLANYSVAKITMDCDFQPPLQYIKQVKKVNFDFTSDASGNYFDMSGNMLFGYDNSGNKVNKNTVYDLEFEGDSLNLISVTQNILDENGEIQWEDTTEQETKYEIRHLDPSGNIITEEEYNTKIAANEDAYIAAFVGCTYHCG
jgi:hypothetical protein